MRIFLILLGREIKAYFYSPIAYVVLFCFLMLIGYNFYGVVSYLSRGTSENTVLEVFFNWPIIWIIALLIPPILTMRLFSEEYKMGTIEGLMTAPVNDWQVVLSKYFGALFFYIILWAPTALYFPIFQWVTKTNAAWTMGAFIGSYTFMLLIGMFYISLGCLASVLTKNQIIAAIISLLMILLFFLSSLFFLAQPNITPFFTDLVSYFSSVEHMASFSTGMFDTRPVVYYLSMTASVLFVTHQIFQSRKWRM